jgi:hypothetical protein
MIEQPQRIGNRSRIDEPGISNDNAERGGAYLAEIKLQSSLLGAVVVL